MTRAGYITDRRCPANPDHGIVVGMRDGGYYCPHSEHTSGVLSKSFWSEDEFEAVKTQPYPEKQTATLKPVAIPARKKKK